MINVIGCGPGSEEYLTHIARSLIDEADVLVGADRLLKLARTNTAERISVTAHIDGALDEIAAHHTGSNQVSVLVTGDPGIFSLAKRVIERFGLENCRIVPGISSVQTAFSRIGLSWDDAAVISAHHELPDIESIDFRSTAKIAVLSGRDDVLVWLKALLRHLEGEAELFACENLTLENESVTKLNIDAIETHSFASRCVFLIIRKDLAI